LKRLLYLAILTMVALVVFSPAASAQDKTVSIQDFSFSPAQITVAPGTTVTWVNEGEAPHTVTSTDGKELDSATLQPGDTYSFTFKEDDAGETYAYQCTIHPEMTASVDVSGGGGTTSSASASMSPSASTSARASASPSASLSASASASVSPKLPDTGGVALPLGTAVALVGLGILALIAVRRRAS
jgi:LPXTG-motif cell wall-anchored protein